MHEVDIFIFRFCWKICLFTR